MDESDVDICQTPNTTDDLKEENEDFTDNLESESGTDHDEQQKDGANDFESLTRPIPATHTASSGLGDSFFKSNDSLEENQRVDESKSNLEAGPSAVDPDYPSFSSPVDSNHNPGLEEIDAEVGELEISQNNSANGLEGEELSSFNFPEVPSHDPGESVGQASTDGGSIASSHSCSRSYLYSTVSAGEDIPDFLQDDGDHLAPKFKANGRGFCWPIHKLPLSGERKFEEGAQWVISEKIGYGAFGECFCGHPTDRGDIPFCVKKCKYNEDEVKALCLAAKDIFAKKISEGAKKIVSFYGATYYKPEVCIFMEYMKGGTVEDAIVEAIIEQENDGLDKTDCVNYFKDVLLALEFIHRKGIVHNDIKTNNVLLTVSKLEAKLCDFGKAGPINPQNPASNDVWSGGCFLLEMLGKKYSLASQLGMLKKPIVLDRLPDDVDHDTKEVLSMCFRIGRDQCTATYVLTSQFFKKN